MKTELLLRALDYNGAGAPVKEMLHKRREMSMSNGFIISNPGDGKFFLVKKEIEEILSSSKDDVFVIDGRGDFDKEEIQSLGGYSIELQPHKPSFCINPLDASIWTCSKMEKQEIINRKIDLFLAILESLIGSENSNARFASSKLDRIINKIYMEIFDNKEKKLPLMSDLVETAYSTDRYIYFVFLNVLKKCECFCHQTNIELNRRLNVFDLQNLGEFSEIGSFFVLEYIGSIAKQNVKEGRKTWVYICNFDELAGWQSRSEHIERLWKRGRMIGLIYTALVSKKISKGPRSLMAYKNPGKGLVNYYENVALNSLLFNSSYYAVMNPSSDDERFLNNFSDMKKVNSILNKKGMPTKSVLYITIE